MVVVRHGQARDRYSNCGVVDWVSYGEVLQASSRIMDNIAYHVTTLSGAKAMHLPILVPEHVQDCKYVVYMGPRSAVTPDLS